MTSSATGNAGRRRGARILATALLAACGVMSAGACRDPAPAGGSLDAGARDAPPASAAASSSAHAEEPVESGGDEVRPVYPFDKSPPLPLAEQYCNAVKETVRKRRDECCPSIGAVALTGECTRTLSSALRSGAVTLETADVEACVGAVGDATKGCDWVTSTGAPTVPACLGIIKGTVKEGALCRSNLECEEGMRCRGLGATRPGKCATRLKQGPCNIATDSLATFTGQEDLERHHPECSGFCSRRQCREVAAGATCSASFECGPKGYCVAGKCAEGAPPGPGQACTDACSPGARCVKGKCATVKAGGEPCEDDAECRGRCARSDGGKGGQCAADCPSFSFPKPPAQKR